MKTFIKTLVASTFFFFVFGLNSAEAQRPTQGTVNLSRVSIKTVVPKLNIPPNAKSQVLNWDNATNFKLNKDGNFTPCFPIGPNSGQGGSRQNSRPYEGPIDLTVQTVNCAKIPCPSSFDKDVVCWECH